MMQVIPAIDIRGGKCVRLLQGDYSIETVFSEDPAEVARRWAAAGASRIHVVDLDGAREGAQRNRATIEALVSAVAVPVQVGGGIRALETAQALTSAGVDRIVVGTAAVENPALVREMVSKLGADALVVAVDAREGYLSVNGWTRESRVLAADLVRIMSQDGVRRFMYTDISRDGTLSEPNFEAVESLLRDSDASFIVAGGVSTVDHLRQLASTRAEAAVVGTALYTGDIDLKEALDAVDGISQ